MEISMHDPVQTFCKVRGGEADRPTATDNRSNFFFFISHSKVGKKNPQQFAAIKLSEEVVLSRRRQLEFDCFAFIDLLLSDLFASAVKIN